MTREALRLPPELLRNCRVLPSRYSLPEHIPQGRVITEIGVAVGGFSQFLIDCCKPTRFIAIDRFNLHELEHFWGKRPREWFGTKTHLEFYTDKFEQIIKAGGMSVLAGDSPAQIARLDDGSVDVFYVDGDHTYDGVWRDLDALRPKIKPSGMIIMNDYTSGDGERAYGVVKATNEFMVKYGYEMTMLCLEPLMYCDVVLQTAGQMPPAAHDKQQQSVTREALLLNEIAQLRGSTSWQVTRPMRAIAGAIKTLQAKRWLKP